MAAVKIHVVAGQPAEGASTVNGSITVNEDAHTSYVKAVNGDLTVKEGAVVSGALTNVNGKISVQAGHIGGGIRTVEGDISILGAAHVDGGILVEKHGGFRMSHRSSDPIITIGPGAEVRGELRFEHKVQLFVSDHASIGTVTGATAVTFSGDSPPYAH